MTICGFSLMSQTKTKTTASGRTPVSAPTAMVLQNDHATKHFLYATGLVLGGAAIGYFLGYKLALRRARVNAKVQLANDKVVDTVDVEDIGEKKAFCRCWRSEKFPYCDGAHTKHNKETGDNVGPLVVKGKH
uniref:CDGSH iron-sulfur domain-containing protein 2 homologue n=1 Tax=Haemonchus contortus TaxID=6289 RepID=U6NH32_HAECO|nr:Iron sulphur-containing domain containing protein [Haemonchus contortus]